MTHRTDATFKILGRIVIIIAALFTLGAWVAFHPFPGRPKVSITFLGYTNDTTDARLATFAITNLNNSTILIYQPLIEMTNPARTGRFGI